MKMIRVEEAVGTILSHDVTQIIPGEFKGRLFKKGHIIKEEDIEKLLSIGKEHVYSFICSSKYSSIVFIFIIIIFFYIL